MVTFQSSRERIGRANEHWTEFQNIWKRTLQDGSYGVTVDVEDDGTGTVRVEQVRAAPTRLSLELGEMLYQLRAALDACVYEAAIRSGATLSPADEKALEFPICERPAQWKPSAGKIAPLTDQQRQIIEDVQPYNIEKFPGTARVVRSLAILNDWARKDRHRRLHVVRAIIEKVAIPRLPDGAPVQAAWVKYEPAHFVEDDPVVARFGVRDWVPGTKLRADQRLTLEVAVDEPPPREPGRDALTDRVRAMFFAVKWVVEAFEETFAPPYPIRKFRAPRTS